MAISNGLEKEIVIRLFKDINIDYNPSTISRVIGKTRVGAYKALKNLEKEKIVYNKRFGKANFYYLRLDDEYVRKHIEILLIEDGRKNQRWIDEFSGLFDFIKVAVLFGSILKKPKTAQDIDLLIILDANYNEKVTEIIKEKNQILMQKIHLIKQTERDFIKNLRRQDNVLVSVIKNGVVLHGYNKYVELIRHVSD